MTEDATLSACSLDPRGPIKQKSSKVRPPKTSFGKGGGLRPAFLHSILSATHCFAALSLPAGEQQNRTVKSRVLRHRGDGGGTEDGTETAAK